MAPVARVLTCGLATLDVLQTVERLPRPDEKVVATDLVVESGGPAANAAVTAALLGVRARLLTRVGTGPLGRVVQEDLEDHGVEVVDVADAGWSPAVSTVLVTRATGDRAVVSVNATRVPDRPEVVRGSRTGATAERAADSRGPGTRADAGLGAEADAGPATGTAPESDAGPATGPASESDAGPTAGPASEVDPASALAVDREVVRSALAGAQVLLVDGHHLDLAVLTAQEARSTGVPVVLDGGSWKPGLETLLGLVDVAVLSADFRVPDSAGRSTPPGEGSPLAWRTQPAGRGSGAGSDAGPEDVLRHVAALGPRVVAQSHGARPIEVLSPAGRCSIDVPTTRVVDTLGAGDVLHGALAAWLATAAAKPALREDGPGADESGGSGGAASGPGLEGVAPERLTATLVAGLHFAAGVATTSCAAPGARTWAADAGMRHTWQERLRNGSS